VSINEMAWGADGTYAALDGLPYTTVAVNMDDGAFDAALSGFEWDEDHVYSYPHTSFLDADNRVSIRSNTATRPESISALLETECHGTVDAPEWIFVPNNRSKTIELAYADGPTGVPVRLNNDGVWDHPVDLDGDLQAPIVLRYFRRNRWPAGLFRLATTYRYNDDGEVIVTVQGPQPSTANAMEVAPWPRLGFPSSSDLENRYNLATFRPGRRLPENPWIIYNLGEDWDSDNLLQATFRTNNGSGYSLEDARAATWDGETMPEQAGSPGALAVTRSYYRYQEWPQRLWSSEWNADGSPRFGRDTFGRFCDVELDESSFESPIADPDQFNYQRWISMEGVEGFTRNISDDGGTIWIRGGESGGIESWANAVYSTNGHHTTMWSTSDGGAQPHLSTYVREAWWPPNVYRRLDTFRFYGGEGYNIEFRSSGESDEPGHEPLAESDHRWGSQIVDDWVRGLEEEIGRPIFENPREGMPWLLLPSNAVQSRGYVPEVEGHTISMLPGHMTQELEVFTEEQTRGVHRLDDGGNYTLGQEFRNGIALFFRPDCTWYLSDDPPETPAIVLVLEKTRQFFESYEDPDLVNDLAVELHDRTQMRADAWRRAITNAESQIRSLNDRIMQFMGQLQENHEKMAYYQQMSLERFKEILERNRVLVEREGALTYGPNHLTLKMPPFNVEGLTIGPLSITLTTGNRAFSIRVEAGTGSNLSQFRNPHPHVDAGGNVCWGNGGTIAQNLSQGIDPLEFLFTTAQFLKTGYHERGAYCSIRNWSTTPTWFCQHCEVRHPENQQCPDYCGHCAEYIDPDDHVYCSVHGICYVPSEQVDDGCPQCRHSAEQSAAAS
jgi:hypothetical protein